MKESFGGKHPYWLLDGHIATNVLAALDHMDKQLPTVRDYYERISEMVHPNSLGHHQFYSTLSNGQKKLPSCCYNQSRDNLNLP
jgi:hypothetical protein